MVRMALRFISSASRFADLQTEGSQFDPRWWNLQKVLEFLQKNSRTTQDRKWFEASKEPVIYLPTP